ncbi:MAG: DNA-directed RNA polymerase subunit beta [Deltaproteobacteria bacterium]|nr:DNA-directed RNA polymerase subunit beta [Deltaproteobacteria bacterium]
MKQRIEAYRIRKNFARVPQVIPIPSLIDIQTRSFDKFLQADIPPEKRDDTGLQGVFKSVFPIRDFNKTSQLEFVSYRLDPPKYEVDECLSRGMTFARPLLVTLRLVIWDTSEDGRTQSVRDIKEKEVYFGDIPIMTEHGTFIINGTERVVVSQLHRSPGVFFNHDKGKHHSSGKFLYSARVIPYRGSWLDFEFDHKDLLYVRIDRRRKLHVTVLLRAMGLNDEDILNTFYKTETIEFDGKELFKRFDFSLLLGQRATRDIKDAGGEVVIQKNQKINKRNLRDVVSRKIERLPVTADEVVGQVFAYDVVNPENGAVIAEANETVTEDQITRIREAGIQSFEVLHMDGHIVPTAIHATLGVDKIRERMDALSEIYRRLRPGDPASPAAAAKHFNSLFFDRERYDLSSVGRVKLNEKIGLHDYRITVSPHRFKGVTVARVLAHYSSQSDYRKNVDMLRVANRAVDFVRDFDRRETDNADNWKPLLVVLPAGSFTSEGSRSLDALMQSKRRGKEYEGQIEELVRSSMVVRELRQMAAVNRAGILAGFDSKPDAGNERGGAEGLPHSRIQLAVYCPPDGSTPQVFWKTRELAGEEGVYVSDQKREDVIEFAGVKFAVGLCAGCKGLDKKASVDGILMLHHYLTKSQQTPVDTVERHKASYLTVASAFVKDEVSEKTAIEGLVRGGEVSLAPQTLRSVEQTTLDRYDILEVVGYLVRLKGGEGSIDDIDNLGNRRVRAVGELLENQYRIGLVRLERSVKETMSFKEVETLKPDELVNTKPVSSVIKEFFGSSQLTQFMDQTNPLSEITHKRRLSALGPGGLTRERAGFEVRDVHFTHYGRICPIETPEGPNIGLISSLSTYARVNDFGFIETPYRRVVNGVVQNEVSFLTANAEEGATICQANVRIGPNNELLDEFLQARVNGEFVLARREEVQYIDVSPNQLVSVAASLIPFLQNDDANRALMGSNMQRQAVPLLRTEPPLVGTGLEQVVARDSGSTVTARRDGAVVYVDANRIVVKAEEISDRLTDVGVDIYTMSKFQRSNQSTCLNQRPIVRIGEKVRRDQVIADGSATSDGELALGQNLVVAFMPWSGYNFEDSILINEKVVVDDRFTSIHIEVFECVARDTKLGPEEITRDIPNVGDEALKNLDEAGIIRIGAEVRSGDILVGKITPKGETQLSPEEKLLRAIFGEKAGDVRDTSLRVPPGVTGTVIGAQVFSRKGIDKDDRAREIEEIEVARLEQDRKDNIKVIRDTAYEKIRDIFQGSHAASDVSDGDGHKLVSKGGVLTADAVEKIPRSKYRDVTLKDDKKNEDVKTILSRMDSQIDLITQAFEDKISRLRKGDELQPGVIKMVKTYVAIKRKLQVGDKMAGRHGNKGVVSRILPQEDMPFMEDGTPVEIVLNPLGVPSRMNVGQVLETHLGWAARGLGTQIGELLDRTRASMVQQLRRKLKEVYTEAVYNQVFKNAADDEIIDACRKLRRGIRLATPVFDGATEDDIWSALEMAGLPRSGQMRLYDGRTGEAFDQPVTVGSMYMLKLHHLVDEKIHARSIGPYSLVTQQPLGGKAQFGGQRLGEMEVWALEAYGAAYTLQEFLTVKSDDIAGRNRMYESIVKGEHTFEPGLPESFNVLVKELQALALDVTPMENDTPVVTSDGSGL